MAKKKEETKYICSDCAFWKNDKCEHASNIKILLKKRIEKRVYKSLEQKTECEFCLIKN